MVVPYVLRKREHIISKFKAKYCRTTHKYGVKLPKNVKEALHLDDISGNTFRRDVLSKEMKKAKVSSIRTRPWIYPGRGQGEQGGCSQGFPRDHMPCLIWCKDRFHAQGTFRG